MASYTQYLLLLPIRRELRNKLSCIEPVVQLAREPKHRYFRLSIPDRSFLIPSLAECAEAKARSKASSLFEDAFNVFRKAPTASQSKHKRRSNRKVEKAKRQRSPSCGSYQLVL
jgi:hypothetical protein